MEPRDLGGDAEPTLRPARPDIRVAPSPLLAGGRAIGGARVDDGEIAEHADEDVVRLDLRYAGARGDLPEERGAIDERAIRVAVHEVRREVAVEPGCIPLVH